MNYTATEPEHSDAQRAGHAPIGSPEARGLEGPTGRPGIHRGFSIIYIYICCTAYDENNYILCNRYYELYCIILYAYLYTYTYIYIYIHIHIYIIY